MSANLSDTNLQSTLNRLFPNNPATRIRETNVSLSNMYTVPSSVPSRDSLPPLQNDPILNSYLAERQKSAQQNLDTTKTYQTMLDKKKMDAMLQNDSLNSSINTETSIIHQLEYDSQLRDRYLAGLKGFLWVIISLIILIPLYRSNTIASNTYYFFLIIVILWYLVYLYSKVFGRRGADAIAEMQDTLLANARKVAQTLVENDQQCNKSVCPPSIPPTLKNTPMSSDLMAPIKTVQQNNIWNFPYYNDNNKQITKSTPLPNHLGNPMESVRYCVKKKDDLTDKPPIIVSYIPCSMYTAYEDPRS
jgi:hypothetical protein